MVTVGLEKRVQFAPDSRGDLAVYRMPRKGGRYIKNADALKHVAGYSCYNEGSVRDWQRHTSQFLAGKTFAGLTTFDRLFVNLTTMSDEELAAKLTTQDFIEIRQLAGDDHGHYENLYGDHENISPRGLSAGPDHRPFRTSGLRLTPTAEGVRGIAFLRNNGGRYEDLYVKTPGGWRIKERTYFPPAKIK